VDAYVFPQLPDDFDGNGFVDLLDFEAFDGCMLGPDEGPVKEGCLPGDDDDDRDIDLKDFTAFQRNLTPEY
jgi:hypothetical protein